eukprot:TRINITY_DN1869_c0_g1_i1.p1 TRINITY_DN1869_c0_g1~~TRINITY_DN1869_c0_g1_i1.p1  ORF type:complete len:197 (+),score=35.79 TRINITY_DN1869_c0_g1_i1:207-797(+)
MEAVVMRREINAGLPTVAYFVGKCCGALVEIGLSATIFTYTYIIFGEVRLPGARLFAISLPCVLATYGLNYCFAIVLPAAQAQMCAVVAAFVAFMLSGFNPTYQTVDNSLGSFGLAVLAISPLRWAFGFGILTEMNHSTEIIQTVVSSSVEQMGGNVTSQAEMWVLAIAYHCLALLVLLVTKQVQLYGWRGVFTME